MWWPIRTEVRLLSALREFTAVTTVNVRMSHIDLITYKITFVISYMLLSEQDP